MGSTRNWLLEGEVDCFAFPVYHRQIRQTSTSSQPTNQQPPNICPRPLSSTPVSRVHVLHSPLATISQRPFLCPYHTSTRPTPSTNHPPPLNLKLCLPPLCPLYPQRSVRQNGPGHPRPGSGRRFRQRLRLQIPLRRTRIRAQRNAFRPR